MAWHYLRRCHTSLEPLGPGHLMSRQQTVRHGQGKHRTVGMSEETPGFKARVIKNRRRNKLAKKARQANRRKQ